MVERHLSQSSINSNSTSPMKSHVLAGEKKMHLVAIGEESQLSSVHHSLSSGRDSDYGIMKSKTKPVKVQFSRQNPLKLKNVKTQPQNTSQNSIRSIKGQEYISAAGPKHVEFDDGLSSQEELKRPLTPPSEHSFEDVDQNINMHSNPPQSGFTHTNIPSKNAPEISFNVKSKRQQMDRLKKFQIVETDLVTQNMILDEEISGLNRRVIDGKIEPEISKI